jgi:hypothetical protein
VARWNSSTQSWSSLGGGIDGASFFTYVSAIAASGSDVYVGGVFPSVGGQVVNNIAHWNDGTAAWSALGQGVTDAIFSIAIGKSGDLYAGGLFSLAGETSAANIARWDGTSWSAMGDGLNGEVYSLGFYNDELFAGGTFSSTGAVGVNHIGRWTGSNWVGVGSGVDRDSTIGFVYAIGTYPDGFYAGGDFTIAGGHPSYYFAHWRRTPFLSAPSLPAIPAGLGLYGYPNPFSSTATIGFTLAKGGPVSLKVYSLRGDEVATLASGMLGAGEHRLTWRPGNLPQGTYIYRLQGGERSESGTIELVR